jgi:hypothetical protein
VSLHCAILGKAATGKAVCSTGPKLKQAVPKKGCLLQVPTQAVKLYREMGIGKIAISAPFYAPAPCRKGAGS